METSTSKEKVANAGELATLQKMQTNNNSNSTVAQRERLLAALRQKATKTPINTAFIPRMLSLIESL